MMAAVLTVMQVTEPDPHVVMDVIGNSDRKADPENGVRNSECV